jgi:hypothetical protein
MNVKILVLGLTVVSNFIVSTYFKEWHGDNVSWLKDELRKGAHQTVSRV